MVRDRLLRSLAVLTIGALGAAACGGDDGDQPTGDDGDAAAPTTSDVEEGPASDYACPPDVVAMLPETLDPETCWAVQSADEPVIIGDTVFALETDVEVGGDPPPVSVVAFDADTSQRLWASVPVPGEVEHLAATEVDGEPGIAALVTGQDEGDAVTEASSSWNYLAWPADAGEDGAEEIEPAVDITTPVSDLSDYVWWTDQGVLAGDRLLAPGADEFVQVRVDPEPIMVGDYDLAESFAGVSGELMLSYVSGVAYPPGNSQHGETHVGWVARDLEGATVWDAVESFPNEGVNAFGEAPLTVAMVVGGYALTIAATDDSQTDLEVTWLDATTGEPAEPRPADIAGTFDVSFNSGALVSPDGAHLFASYDTLDAVLDVASGEATVVESDFDIGVATADDARAYGSTENGALTIDWNDATATAVEPLGEGIVAVGDDHAAITVTEIQGEVIDTLVVARMTG